MKQARDHRSALQAGKGASRFVTIRIERRGERVRLLRNQGSDTFTFTCAWMIVHMAGIVRGCRASSAVVHRLVEVLHLLKSYGVEWVSLGSGLVARRNRCTCWRLDQGEWERWQMLETGLYYWKMNRSRQR
jgi:hypothetical protein